MIKLEIGDRVVIRQIVHEHGEFGEYIEERMVGTVVTLGLGGIVVGVQIPPYRWISAFHRNQLRKIKLKGINK